MAPLKMSDEKHRLATRWFHWVNFPLLSVMIVSGLLIYWAYDPYRVGAGTVTLFHFFPDGFYNFTHIDHKLATGMAWHFLFAWLFGINGVAYVIYTLASGEWRELVPERKSFREALDVVRHDLGMNVAMPPQGRYNAAQRITYSAIVLMGGLSLLTGLAIYKPAQLHWLTALAGGYEWARWEHFWLTMGYVGFFLLHVAQVVRAGWPNFRSMVTGYDLAGPARAAHTRRSFAMLGVGAVASFAGWKWLNSGAHEEGDIPPAFRRVLGWNEGVIRGTVFSDRNLTRTYPESAVRPIKVNGKIGIDEDLDPNEWRLALTPLGSTSPARHLTAADIRSLPRYEEIIDFKCVEGWSTVTRFAGARLSDFTAKFAPGSRNAACIGMKTPDEDYYVSIDMPSALHPQTLLAYEMNGEPLTIDHGAPLRLISPVKYGIKNIKQIGSIEYTNERPDDYWAERGYDWYAGL